MQPTKRIVQILAAVAVGGLSLSAPAQIGTGWTSTTVGFKIQTEGSGKVSGNTFSLGSSTSGKQRAERRYDAISSGQRQFQGDVKVASLGGDRICLKQTFQQNSGPWNMIAVKKSGSLYEVEGGATLAAYTVGSTARINTLLNASKGTVQVYINGSLKETKTGGKVPIYDKCGTYATSSGKGPVTATWNNVTFWKK